MRTKRAMAAGAVALALVVGGAGCGAIAEKATEKAVEKATGCEDIDASGEQVGAECDGVSANVDADGNVAVTDEDGNSIDASADGSAALPEGWPAELAPPADARITSATVSGDDLGLTAALDGDVAEVFSAIKGQLEQAGYTIESDTVADAAEGTVASATASGPDLDATVSVTSNVGDTSLGSVLVVYNLTRAAG